MQRLLLAIAQRAVRLYYHVRHMGGAVPAEGPVLLVGNHPNGLVDPVLVGGTTRRPVRFLGKAPLFDMPLLGSVLRGMQVLPVYRRQDGVDTRANAPTFEAVYGALEQGSVVCLFPEGKSHDQPSLQELRTGAARMALGAEARRQWSLGVRIIPVGLVYRSKKRFRSRVAVWTGKPIEARAFAQEHAHDERAAVGALTEEIASGLKAVTLDLEHWEDLPLLELAERILFTARAGRLERLQAFARALHALRARDPRRVELLSERIALFGTRLERLGLTPHDLPQRLEQPYHPGSVARFVLRNLAVLFVALPFAAAGAAFWFLPNRLAGGLPRRFSGPDTLATARILAACLFFPTWLLLAVLASWRLAGPDLAIGVLLVAPLMGPVALAFRDWRLETWSEVRIFFSLLTRKSLRELLSEERASLARELGTIRADL